MSKILFSPLEDKIHIFKPFSFYYIDSMQKAVNDVINIFTSEDMENMHVTCYFLVMVLGLNGTSSEHSVRIYVGRKNAALEINPNI